jgi:hypothetical protein
MFERFTDRARKVMALANAEALRFNHEHIGTEHILLGIVREGSGVGASVLKNLGGDLRKVRLEIEQLVSKTPERVTMGRLPQTPRAQQVIQYALEESRRLSHNYVGTEHLLLGLLRAQDSVAAQALVNVGLSLDDARDEVLNLLTTDGPIPFAAPLASPADAEKTPRRVGVRGRPDFERRSCETVLPGADIEIVAGSGLALVPHDEQFGGIFTDAICPAMEANGIQACKAGDIYQPGAILSQVWTSIRTAEVIVADVSGCNPNVIYELGLCFGLHRCPIIITRDERDVPFNLRTLRYIEYEDTAAGSERLRHRLAESIKAFLHAVRGPAGGAT